MTDLQTITVMFTRAQIAFTIDATRDAGHGSGNNQPLPPGMTITTYRVDDDRPRHFGYVGFYAELYFDQDGALIGVGAWE